jgi:hypothetical protein
MTFSVLIMLSDKARRIVREDYSPKLVEEVFSEVGFPLTGKHSVENLALYCHKVHPDSFPAV